jgi:PAS domain S-box-containing protein
VNRTITHPLSGPHDLVDEPGVAYVLRVTIGVVFASLLAVAVFTYFLGWTVTPLLCLGTSVSTLVAWFLARSGRTRAGILLTLAGVAYVVLHVSARNDGMQNIGLAVVPVVLVVGSVLLERLKLVLFTAAALGGTFAMLAIRFWLLRREPFTSGEIGDYFVFVVICLLAATIGRLLVTQIRQGVWMSAANERRYRRIFENIQDVYYEIGSDGTFFELSPAASELFGESHETIVRRSLKSYCVKPAEFDAFAESILRDGRVSNHELVIRGGRGELVHALLNGTLYGDRQAGPQRLIGSIRDITLRRRAEDALRESEARLRIALEASGAGTFDYYHEKRLLICSEISKRHFGVLLEEDCDLEGFLAAVHPEDRERVVKAALSAAAPGRQGEFKVEFRTIGVEDARVRWIAARGRMLFDPLGAPARLIGTTLDTSDRKRLEEDLRQRAEELQTIMDVAPVGLFTAHDPECRQVTVNRMANAMMETAEGSFSREAPGGPISPRRFLRNGVEVPSDQLPLQTAARGVEVRDAELEAVLPNGIRKILTVHAVPLFDPAGSVRGAIAAAQDVTSARQRAADLLRESEERFRTTADAAPVMIWFGDPEGRLTFVNEQFVRFTGLTVEYLLGHGWTQTIHPDDLEPARALFSEAAGARASHQLECRVRRADGAYRHLLGTTHPRYAGSEYAGQVGSAIDITDLKRREEENLVRQKLESIGILASGIAHDFNNLMGSVLAQSELASTLLAAGERPTDELKRIGDVARRGSEIVRQLMMYAGRENEPSAQVDVSRIVTEMLDLLGVSISKHATLKAELGAELPPVRADAAQIRQIVMNLITNASEAIEGADGEIRVATSKEGDSVRLEVSDTGCGMDRETQGRIFDPFFTKKSAGRGLGLAVVQGIVSALDGAIEVVSEPGKGATFVVLLPCAEPDADATVPPPARPESAAGPAETGAILIVDDEDLLRQPLAKMLRKHGFSVTEAGDGAAALEAIRSNSPVDVLLLDITLPGVSSDVVFGEAKRLVPRIQVIATTAYSEDKAVATLRRKPDYFIRKPYRVAVLVELVQRAMASRTKN